MRILETREKEIGTFDELRDEYENKRRTLAFCAGFAIGFGMLFFLSLGWVSLEQQYKDQLAAAQTSCLTNSK